MEKTREEEILTAKKEEVVDIYEDLLKKVWDRIVLTLGAVTVVALWRRVIKRTAKKYTILQYLDVTTEGIQFQKLKSRISEQEKKIIKDGFEELILDLFDLLAELTGDMIVDKLFKNEVTTKLKSIPE
ncbi:MAG: hypothetical protein AB1414_13010 [bacterium]